MRWYFPEPGALGIFIGTGLIDAGENVNFAFLDPSRESILNRSGLDLLRNRMPPRWYDLSISPPDGIEKPVDVLFLAIRRDRCDFRFIEWLAPAVGRSTIIIYMITCFDVPEPFLKCFHRNRSAVAYPYAMIGRILSQNQVFAVKSRRGNNLVIGPAGGTSLSDISGLINLLENSGLKVKIVKNPLDFSRISASFFLALYEAARDFKIPIESGFDRKKERLTAEKAFEILDILRKNGRGIPFRYKLVLYLNSIVFGGRISRIALSIFGEQLEQLLEEENMREAAVLMDDYENIKKAFYNLPKSGEGSF